jgi:hypothetical protein
VAWRKRKSEEPTELEAMSSAELVSKASQLVGQASAVLDRLNVLLDTGAVEIHDVPATNGNVPHREEPANGG